MTPKLGDVSGPCKFCLPEKWCIWFISCVIGLLWKLKAKLKVYGSLEKTTRYTAVMITKFRVVIELRPAWHGWILLMSMSVIRVIIARFILRTKWQFFYGWVDQCNMTQNLMTAWYSHMYTTPKKQTVINVTLFSEENRCKPPYGSQFKQNLNQTMFQNIWINHDLKVVQSKQRV